MKYKRPENIYGVRLDKIEYFLTKEVEFTFPDEKFYYFNTRTGKVGEKILKGKTIKVELNSKLEYAQSAQDFLDVFLKSQIEPIKAKEDKEFLVLGIKPWKFFISLFVTIILLIFLCRFFNKFKVRYNEILLREADSEESWFLKLKKESKKGNTNEFFAGNE